MQSNNDLKQQTQNKCLFVRIHTRKSLVWSLWSGPNAMYIFWFGEVPFHIAIFRNSPRICQQRMCVHRSFNHWTRRSGRSSGPRLNDLCTHMRCWQILGLLRMCVHRLPMALVWVAPWMHRNFYKCSPTYFICWRLPKYPEDISSPLRYMLSRPRLIFNGTDNVMPVWWRNAFELTALIRQYK